MLCFLFPGALLSPYYRVSYIVPSDFFFSSVLMQSFCLGCLLRVCCRVLCILKAIRDGHCKLA